jgi:hypothetical protein
MGPLENSNLPSLTHLEIGIIFKPIEQNRNILKIRKAKRKKKHIIIIADLPTQALCFAGRQDEDSR